MSITLSPGANAALPATPLELRLDSPQPLDLAAYRLDAGGRVRGDDDMIFYGQPVCADGSVRFAAGRFQLDLARQPAEITTIALAFAGERPVAELSPLRLSLWANGAEIISGPLDLAGRPEKALILGECYRRGDGWKFRLIGQGFNGGLKPLSEHFGVEVADAPSTPPSAGVEVADAPPAPAPINLSKITLDKARPRVSLSKQQQSFGRLAVNLNWNPAPAGGSGFLGGLFGKSSAIDLDLGAFIRFRDGQQDCVQALGKRFGSLERAPYVRLRGDDRSGAVAEGEWLDINGDRWDEIAEILVYAFIYEGAPNWAATDGVVTLHVQGQEIVSRLSEGDNRRNMCAIARLLNDKGQLAVERVNRYFSGHQEMDRALGWGFNWTSGRK